MRQSHIRRDQEQKQRADDARCHEHENEHETKRLIVRLHGNDRSDRERHERNDHANIECGDDGDRKQDEQHELRPARHLMQRRTAGNEVDYQPIIHRLSPSFRAR